MDNDDDNNDEEESEDEVVFETKDEEMGKCIIYFYLVSIFKFLVQFRLLLKSDKKAYLYVNYIPHQKFVSFLDFSL